MAKSFPGCAFVVKLDPDIYYIQRFAGRNLNADKAIRLAREAMIPVYSAYPDALSVYRIYPTQDSSKDYQRLTDLYTRLTQVFFRDQTDCGWHRIPEGKLWRMDAVYQEVCHG